ncbi:ATP-binding protein [Bacillus sp. FJAT-27264]|uniref:ATP-binding protein n=1 Tax=Paenibacillus sp. (strain DSM 101736 / FJAT-27264) TaxID=1850362 RepID=UPI00158622C4|nr:ATP-binding protein [Bacillus sp. FJAT-27264]
MNRRLVFWVHVAAENKGDSIPDEQQASIWERFYRGEGSRNRKSGSISLELSTVKEIMQLHEGGYGVQNIRGGVQFYFVLKRPPQAENPA